MEELRNDKVKLEEKVLELINEFEEKYETYIIEINLLHEVEHTLKEDKTIAKTKKVITRIQI